MLDVSVLVVTAVAAEAEAIGELDGATVVAGGIGRVNAAIAVTRACAVPQHFTAVVSAGVAGILPGSELSIGDVLLGTAAIYVEEGLQTPAGFQDIAAMGFALGGFAGNRIDADAGLLAMMDPDWPRGPIATVATCSGTDQSARMVQTRTRAMAEAMEGAAVLHAAAAAGVPAIEIRTMSNTTGDRDSQVWDLPAALEALGPAVAAAVADIG